MHFDSCPFQRLGRAMDNSNYSGEELLYELLAHDEEHISDKKKTESLVFLKELSGYNIHRLQLEPMKLKEENEHIMEDIQNLAFSNYKTFIRTAQCSREIYQDFSIIENKLDSLTSKIPEFSSKCESFTKNIQTINASRRMTNITLQKHNQLLEILEISQLMDTCVRNEYYDEALELAAYVKRLEKKFGTSISLIQQIVEDVKLSLQLMLKQLLQQLKTHIQFPQCLKVIGLIRRLDIFTESQLRIKFLQLRDTWLQKLLDNIPNEDPYHYVCKTIDENRVHLFDIITQYKALFSDDDLTMNFNMNNILLTKDSNCDSKLFNCWILDKVSRFLNTLRSALKVGVGNRLDSVLSQAMYFGLAFSRVGLDFRLLIVQIFEDSAFEQFELSVQNSNARFNELMQRFSFNDLLNDTATAMLFMNDASASVLLNKKNGINPPYGLLEFHPLAVYLNCLLQAFNDFRLCAPLNLVVKMRKLIEESLCRLADAISVFLKQNTFDSNEKELVNKFLKLFAYDLVPYVETCLGVLFPLQQLQKAYGVQQTDVEKLKSLTRLNENLIFKSVKHVLPAMPIIESVNHNTVDDKNTDAEVLTDNQQHEPLGVENGEQEAEQAKQIKYQNDDISANPENRNFDEPENVETQELNEN
jgi:hypothetical protein